MPHALKQIKLTKIYVDFFLNDQNNVNDRTKMSLEGTEVNCSLALKPASCLVGLYKVANISWNCDSFIYFIPVCITAGCSHIYNIAFHVNLSFWLNLLVCVVAAVREPCIEAGLVKVLVPHLNSDNQEMLLNSGRAIGRICFDNCELVSCCWLSQLGFLVRWCFYGYREWETPTTWYFRHHVQNICAVSEGGQCVPGKEHEQRLLTEVLCMILDYLVLLYLIGLPDNTGNISPLWFMLMYVKGLTEWTVLICIKQRRKTNHF